MKEPRPIHDEAEKAAIEHNRRILATFPREKLIQLCRDRYGDVQFGPKPGEWEKGSSKLEDLNDDELRDFALAATGYY